MVSDPKWLERLDALLTPAYERAPAEDVAWVQRADEWAETVGERRLFQRTRAEAAAAVAAYRGWDEARAYNAVRTWDEDRMREGLTGCADEPVVWDREGGLVPAPKDEDEG